MSRHTLWLPFGRMDDKRKIEISEAIMEDRIRLMQFPDEVLDEFHSELGIDLLQVVGDLTSR